MNKYEVVLDILRDKILFVPSRYNYDENKSSNIKDIIFLSNGNRVKLPTPTLSIKDNLDINDDIPLTLII